MTTELKKPKIMHCPICEADLEYRRRKRESGTINKNTHAFICTECPCVILEHFDNEDIDNLKIILK